MSALAHLAVESAYRWLTVPDPVARARVRDQLDALSPPEAPADAPADPERQLLLDAYVAKPRPLFTRLPGSYRLVPRALSAALLTVQDRRGRRTRDDGRFPAWPIESRLDERRARTWAAAAAAVGMPVSPPLYPDGRRAALLLTHDVDSSGELRLIEAIRTAERERGVPSAFGVVPAVSWPADAQVAELTAEGCELYCHDLAHDGRLPYMGPGRIREGLARALGRSAWAPSLLRGFRSGQLLMSSDLLAAVAERFAFDLSIPDTERTGPYGPVAGCGSVFPFSAGPLLEIPLTLPQDFYLLHVYRLSPEESLAIWQAKLAHIRRLGGVAVLNAHPVWVNPAARGMWATYQRLLDRVVESGDWWVTTPSALTRHLAELREGA